jgi:hypothetical protein
MPHSRFCKVCKDFHDLDQPWPTACAGHFASARSTGPHIILDTMEPIRSMADGKMYDSKSVYTRSVKAHGCEIIGNDKLPERRPVERPRAAQDIRRAIEQLRG